MKKRIIAFVTITFLTFASLQVNMNIMPSAFSSESVAGKEIWKIVNITNPMPYNTIVDINVSVTSRQGVHIACSANITAFFENSTGYATWWDWLNGNETVPYHWGEMDWSVSNGSLTSISYDKIQHWGDMYLDSGGGVEYITFMGNTYMADWNLTSPYNDPDIISEVYWHGNQIKIIDDMVVSNDTTVYLVFKIVITNPGTYTFNVTSTPGTTVSPSSWIVGGVDTHVVPYDYPTIQEAIDAASAENTIIVYSGNYVEDLLIPSTKTNLEIKTAQGASATIKGVQNVPVASWPLAAPNIEINASGVKIHGFTIEGPDYESGYYSSGIVIGAPNVEIYNNTFKVTPANTLDEISQAIQTYHKSAVPGVDVSGLKIYNNTFTHLSPGTAGYEGIYINLDAGTGKVTVENNLFTGNIVRAVTTERSNVSITGNIILTDLAPGLPGSYQGINVGGVNAGNVSDVSVANNVIKGFQYGVKLGYSASSILVKVDIEGNTIQDGNVGVWVRFSASGTKVRWNNILNNTDYGVLNDAPESLNAAYNWWGNETGPKHLTLNPDGMGDNVSDNVVFEPWLIKPYPPSTPITVVYVTPKSISLEVPSLGTQFAVYVTIANVSGLYGFQFTIKWNSSLLMLTNPTTAHRIPSVWENNYISQYNYSLTDGNYTLFASARSPAPTFNGTTDVAIFIFKSVYDPIYPQNVTCDLSLENVDLVDKEAEAIPHLVYSGNYSCYSKMPELVLSPQEPSAYKVPAEFDVNVSIIIVVDLSAFEFELQYNKTLLEVLAVDVPFPAPIVGYGDGKVYVNVTGITPPINGSRVLATIRFKAARGIVWNTQTHLINSSLNFTIHRLNGGLIEHKAINGTYHYTPVPGDLDMDGAVTIIDLSAAARSFGTSMGDPGYQRYADLNLDGYINIRDIVLIARNFGREGP